MKNRFLILLGLLDLLAMATEAQAQVGTWTVVRASSFSGTTTVGAAGTTAGAGDDGKWTDVHGGVAAVNSSNVLNLTTDNVDIYSYRRDLLLRPVGEETQNQRIDGTTADCPQCCGRSCGSPANARASRRRRSRRSKATAAPMAS